MYAGTVVLFPGLYHLTCIHSQLKTRMEELIRNAFSTRDASHMALGKDYAYWTSRPVANTRNLTVNQLVEMFNFLIDNIYTFR